MTQKKQDPPDYQIKYAVDISQHITGPLVTCDLISQNDLLAAAGVDTKFIVINAQTGKVTQTFKGHEAGINEVTFSNDGKHIATASNDKTLRLWDCETGKCLQICKATEDGQKGHTHYVSCCAFQPPDATVLVSGGYDEAVRVWDLVSGKQIRAIPAHSDPVTAVDVSGSSQLQMVSSSFDGVFREWDMGSGRCIGTRHVLTDREPPPLTNIQFTPNYKHVLVSSLNSQMSLWTVGQDNNKPITVYPKDSRVQGHVNNNYQIKPCFAQSQYVCIGNEADNSIVIYSLSKRTIVQSLKGRKDAKQRGNGHTSIPMCVSASGKLLASVAHGDDHFVRIWEDCRQSSDIKQTTTHQDPK